MSLNPGHAPTGDHVRRLRDELPRRFPGCTFYFLPADITGQILNFGKPAPIDVQVVGVDRAANLAVAKKLRRRIARVPGVVDAHVHQVTDAPDLRVDVDRVTAQGLNLTQRDVATSLLVSLSSTSQVAPNFWVNPRNRVNYRVEVQTPQGRVDSVEALLSTPVVSSAAPAAPQLLENVAEVRRATSETIVNHADIQAVYDVYAAVEGRDLGAVAADADAIVAAARAELPRGTTLAVRGQVESMSASFRGLGYGLAFAVLLVYLLMVVNFQSWVDPLVILTALPGAVAGIAWSLWANQTTVSVPALMGAIMCLGVATGVLTAGSSPPPGRTASSASGTPAAAARSTPSAGTSTGFTPLRGVPTGRGWPAPPATGP